MSVDELEKIKADIRRRLENYAKRAGFELNPDEAKVTYVIDGLAQRKVSRGKAYCPCRVISGDPKADKKIICPCVYHRQEIADKGICHCELFVSPGCASGHGSEGK